MGESVRVFYSKSSCGFVVILGLCICLGGRWNVFEVQTCFDVFIGHIKRKCRQTVNDFDKCCKVLATFVGSYYKKDELAKD